MQISQFVRHLRLFHKDSGIYPIWPRSWGLYCAHGCSLWAEKSGCVGLQFILFPTGAAAAEPFADIWMVCQMYWVLGFYLVLVVPERSVEVPISPRLHLRLDRKVVLVVLQHEVLCSQAVTTGAPSTNRSVSHVLRAHTCGLTGWGVCCGVLFGAWRHPLTVLLEQDDHYGPHCGLPIQQLELIFIPTTPPTY